MGGHPDADKMDLIITAQGNTEFFFAVELLVSKAPKFNDWNVIAFKPPMGSDFTTEYGGMEFDPKKTLFLPLATSANKKAVGMRVCYPDFEEESQDVFLVATHLMLEVILGEKAVALDIDYLEVKKTPENIGDYLFGTLAMWRSTSGHERRELEPFFSKKRRRLLTILFNNRLFGKYIVQAHI